MTVVTKDYKEIDCKFVDFTPNDVLPDGNDVKIILWDDSVEYEKMSNLSYIKP